MSSVYRIFLFNSESHLSFYAQGKAHLFQEATLDFLSPSPLAGDLLLGGFDSACPIYCPRWILFSLLDCRTCVPWSSSGHLPAQGSAQHKPCAWGNLTLAKGYLSPTLKAEGICTLASPWRWSVPARACLSVGRGGVLVPLSKPLVTSCVCLSGLDFFQQPLPGTPTSSAPVFSTGWG